MDEVALYVSQSGELRLNVRADADTVWLTRMQLAKLFGRDVKTIGKHVAAARREELNGVAVVAKFATTASDGKSYQVEHYNLDMILSVGYRVKSPEGVHFRRWANDVLKRYVIDGAALNAHRLEQLDSVVRILGRSTDDLVSGVADVLSTYLPSLVLLRDYDEGQVASSPRGIPGWTLGHDEAREVIARVAAEFPKDNLLGKERGDALDGVLGAVYQGFGDQDVYPTVEEKAANLLYFVVKDHPLSDGNKRCAAALFVTFLARNDALLDPDGDPRISTNALAALTLMVAMSEPREKDLMTSLLVRMLTDD